MTVLRLEPRDPTVRVLTAKALAASRGAKAALTVRCATCKAWLAAAGHTSSGPLFTSSWRVEDEGDRIQVNRRLLTPRESRRFLDGIAPVLKKSGGEVRLRDGVVGLLALPLGVTADYPDLLVRCDDHGDAVLDRGAVLERLHTAASPAETWAVAVAFPRRDHLPTSVDWLAGTGETHTTSVRRQIGGGVHRDG